MLLQPISAAGPDYAGSADQTSRSGDVQSPLLQETLISLDTETERSGCCRNLWTDRSKRTAVAAVAVGGGAFALVAISAGITYATTHNVYAVAGVLGAGTAIIGCIAGCIEQCGQGALRRRAV